jgi:mannose-6-phosphate isomerase-like protein (cupin superfamily)
MIVSPLAGDRIGGSDTSFVIVEWTIAADEAGRPMAPFHVHHEDDEAWYVLEGALRVRLGDRDVEIGAGGAALAARGVPHTYWNPRPEPARYLLVMTPRVQALIDAIHGLEDRSEAARRQPEGETFT